MSQKDQIYEWMKRHGSITPIVALNTIGCFRLSARIAELRREGRNIETTKKEYYRNGERKCFAEYKLLDE